MPPMSPALPAQPRRRSRCTAPLARGICQWALAGLALCLVAGPAAANPEARKEVQDTFSAYLGEQGYRPTISDKGNILFKAEGRTYVIYIDDTDPTYFRLVLTFTAKDEGEALRQRRLEALNEVTRTIKSVKAYLNSQGHIEYAVEVFQNKVGDITGQIPRMLRALTAANLKFNERMK